MSDLTELKSGHVFRMRSVHDVFRKLWRERERFEKALKGLDRADQMDAAINFAITAWHLTDWVWCRHKAELRKTLEVNDLRGLQDKVRQECPGLAVCDVIANAAKHGGIAHERDDRPSIETVLIAESVGDSGVDVELIAEQATRRWWQRDRGWSLKIEVDGKDEDLPSLLTSIFSFWHKFIQQHCVTKQP